MFSLFQSNRESVRRCPSPSTTLAHPNVSPMQTAEGTWSAVEWDAVRNAFLLTSLVRVEVFCVQHVISQFKNSVWQEHEENCENERHCLYVIYNELLFNIIQWNVLLRSVRWNNSLSLGLDRISYMKFWHFLQYLLW